jgi:hypothetical protein
MRLRITRELPPRFNGFDAAHLRLGETYEIGETLGAWRLAYGFAVSAEPLTDKSARTPALLKPSAFR